MHHSSSDAGAAAGAARGAAPIGPSHAYRPDIDGLRALAVLAVVVYHAFPKRLPGGFVGVDIFFVISGYLISSIVFADLEAGRFTYADFYARRIRRIFPALITVLLATLGAGYLLAFPDELARLGRHLVAGAAFVSNIVLWSESGYFERAAETKPLLHLWSLGVEEQFYIVWPVLALLTWRLRSTFTPVALLLGALSFAANLAWVHERQSLVFYMPFTRIWELLVGSMLASAAHGRLGEAGRALGANVRAPWRDAASVLGLALLVVALMAIDTQSVFPGWWAVLPVLGTALLIAAGSSALVNRTLLSLRPAVAIGLISYPLYLWHWPILVFGREATESGLVRWGGLAAIAASVALAVATYRWIEQPLRFGPLRKRAVPLLSAGMLVVAGLGVVTHFGLIPSRFMDRADFLNQFVNDAPSYRYMTRTRAVERFRLDCSYFDEFELRPRAALSPDCVASSSARKVMIWGDSHAQHLRYGLQRALPDGVGVLQVTSSGCAPALADRPHDPYGSCNRANRAALAALRAQRPDVVILAQSRDHDKAPWAELVAEIRRHGVRKVVVMGPVPQWEPDLRVVVARHHWPTPPRRISDHLREGPFRWEAQLKPRINAIDGAVMVSAIDVLCERGECSVYLGDDLSTGLTTFDYGHLTPIASEAVGQALARRVLEVLEAGR